MNGHRYFELPYSLPANASKTVECDADRVFLDDGPATDGVLAFKVDELPEIDVRQGFYAVLSPFTRITIRNKTAAPITGHLVYSKGEFLAWQPGGGGGGGVSDSWDGFAGESYRNYPMQVVLPGTGSGGSSATLRNPVVELDTGVTAAPSKFRQMAEELNARPMFFTVGTTNFWDRRHRVRARVYPYFGGGSDDNSQYGIVLGLPSAHPMTSASACVKLVSVAASGVWRLYVANGVTLSQADLVGVTAPAFNRSFKLEIDYNKPSNYCAAFVDGVEGARITTNLLSGTGSRGAGCFVGEDGTSLDRVAAAYMALEATTYVP